MADVNYEYLKKNKRDLYIDNFFEIMDFSIANNVYDTVLNNETTFKI